jgi:hypothetical protein
MLRRRPVVVRRGPSVLGAATRTAVVVGTATAVSGAVVKRSAGPGPQAAPPAASQAPAASPPTGPSSGDRAG